jgi:mannitol-1-phosphate/altronate dehydrogenase
MNNFFLEQLKLRMKRGLKPFTVLSCDNMPDNGHVAKKMCLQLAEKIDPKLAEWIEEKVPFPVTMVDRITPITTLEDIQDFKEGAKIEDG